jgi:hypothetical protein
MNANDISTKFPHRSFDRHTKYFIINTKYHDYEGNRIKNIIFDDLSQSKGDLFGKIDGYATRFPATAIPAFLTAKGLYYYFPLLLEYVCTRSFSDYNTTIPGFLVSLARSVTPVAENKKNKDVFALFSHQDIHVTQEIFSDLYKSYLAKGIKDNEFIDLYLSFWSKNNRGQSEIFSRSDIELHRRLFQGRNHAAPAPFVPTQYSTTHYPARQ